MEMENVTRRFDLIILNNEEGFEDGYHILEVNKSDLHVIWQSDLFASKEDAIQYFESEFEGEILNIIE